MVDIDQGTLEQLIKASTKQDDQGDYLDSALLESKIAEYATLQKEVESAESGIAAINKSTKEDLGLLNSLQGTALEAPIRFAKDVGSTATKSISDLIGLAAFAADKTNPMTGLAQSAGLNPRTYSQDAAAFEQARNEVFGTPDLEDKIFPYKMAVKGLGSVPLAAISGGASAVPSLIAGGAGGPLAEKLGLPSIVGEIAGGLSPSFLKSFLSAPKNLAQPLEDVVKAATRTDVGVKAGGRATGRQAEQAGKYLMEVAQSPSALTEKLSYGDDLLKGTLGSSLRQVVPDTPASTVQEGVNAVLGSESLAGAKNIDEAIDIVKGMIDETGSQRVQLAQLLDETGARIKASSQEVGQELKKIATDESLPSEVRQLHDEAMVYLRNLDQGVAPSVALNDLMNLNRLRDSLKPYISGDAKYGTIISKLDYQIDALGEAVAKGFDTAIDKYSKKLPEELKGASFNTLTNQLRSLYTTQRIFGKITSAAGREARGIAEASGKGAVKRNASDVLYLKGLLDYGTDIVTKGLSSSKGRMANNLERPAAELGILRSLAKSPEELQAISQELGKYSTTLGNLKSTGAASLAALGLGGSGIALAEPNNNFITPDSTGGFMPSDQIPLEQMPAEPLSPEQQALGMTPEQDLGFDPTLQGIGNIDSSSFYDDKVNIPDESVLQEKEQNAEQIGTLPRGTSALVNLSEAGKDLSDLGFSDEVAKSAGSLLGGSQDDQRQGLSLLMQDKPSLFEQSPLPGYNSLVDGIIQDNAEKLRFQQKIRDVFRTDPVRQAQAIEAVRRNEAVPKWSYKYLGGEDQTSFEDKFLQDVEAMKTKAYLDTEGNPTIGIGVNLAAQSLDGLRDMSVPEEILQKISPLIGTKGSRASSTLKFNPVELSDDEAMTLSKAVQQANYDFLNELVRQDTGATLEDLPIEGRTVLLSLGYNFGSNLKRNKPEIWNAAMSGKWDRVQSLLKGMNTDKKGLRNRRLKEAALLNPLVDKKMELAMNTDVDMPAIDGTVKLSDGTKKTVYRF